jgi:uncharacterized membrane protein YcaP (DUF421 family)
LNYLVVRFLFRRTSLDRFLEGSPVLLIKNGRIQKKQLDHELISIQELTTVARKQGFRSLDDIEECVLETGGSLVFIAKDPAPAQTHYEDLIQRLEAISRQLQALQPTERGDRPAS